MSFAQSGSETSGREALASSDPEPLSFPEELLSLRMFSSSKDASWFFSSFVSLSAVFPALFMDFVALLLNAPKSFRNEVT